MRKISDDEIKPTLRLKHQAVALFSEAHGVNIGWLLEGDGEMFKSSAPLLTLLGKGEA